jgi:hypothetical protein
MTLRRSFSGAWSILDPGPSYLIVGGGGLSVASKDETRRPERFILKTRIFLERL